MACTRLVKVGYENYMIMKSHSHIPLHIPQSLPWQLSYINTSIHTAMKHFFDLMTLTFDLWP